VSDELEDREDERRWVEFLRERGWTMVVGEHAFYWQKDGHQVSSARAVEIERGIGDVMP
jgi:hypothetical protein